MLLCEHPHPRGAAAAGSAAAARAGSATTGAAAGNAAAAPPKETHLRNNDNVPLELLLELLHKPGVDPLHHVHVNPVGHKNHQRRLPRGGHFHGLDCADGQLCHFGPQLRLGARLQTQNQEVQKSTKENEEGIQLLNGKLRWNRRGRSPKDQHIQWHTSMSARHRSTSFSTSVGWLPSTLTIRCRVVIFWTLQSAATHARDSD